MKVAAEFVTSAAGAGGFPGETLPELAIVGRSNVGKSTLINALTRQKLARTSAAPGKTRLANFFRITPDGRAPFFLVDLPGFGYARGGHKAREAFDELAAAYFESRSGAGHGGRFSGVLMLVDSRHPDLDADRRAWNWMGRLEITRHVVATKVDKLTQAERHRHLGALERAYSGPVTAVSALTGEGLDELWKTIVKLVTRP